MAASFRPDRNAPQPFAGSPPGRPVRVAVVALAALSALSCNRVKDSQATLDQGETLFGALATETGKRLHKGNRLTLLEDGSVFPAIEREIRAARSSIHILVYIWRGEGEPSSTIGAAILARRPGVACRIIVDPFGSLKFDDKLEADLKRSGCEIHSYDRGPMPEPRARNHRKIVIVDGDRAITGGFGIWKSWLGQGRKEEEWRDTAVLAEGPVVEDLQRAFDQNWQEVQKHPLPKEAYPPLSAKGDIPAMFIATSPKPNQPSAAEAMYRLLVQSAKKRLWIANSYFIPGEGLQKLMLERKRAGVDVRVLSPGPVHDVPPVRAAQRATYETLIEGGIRMFEYEPSMMHSKTVMIDDTYILIGSTNMDALSFEHLEEGSLVARDPALCKQMTERFERDQKLSKEITKHLWRNRDTLPEVGRRGASLFSDSM
ncbi:MAG TPA: phospholipase D-like domain-containing protein [Polyangia bacterium]